MEICFRVPQQQWENYGPVANCGSLPVSVEWAAWECSHMHLSMHCVWLPLCCSGRAKQLRQTYKAYKACSYLQGGPLGKWAVDLCTFRTSMFWPRERLSHLFNCTEQPSRTQCQGRDRAGLWQQPSVYPSRHTHVQESADQVMCLCKPAPNVSGKLSLALRAVSVSGNFQVRLWLPEAHAWLLAKEGKKDYNITPDN